MKIARIDCAARKGGLKPLAEELLPVGGRGLIARIMSEEIPGDCDALGEKNKIIICNGPLAGVAVSSAGRLSVGGKSPMTGGIKESNSGGTAAEALAKLGLRALVLEGIPAADAPWQLIEVTEEGIRFHDAADYLGLGNYALAERLFGDFGKDYSLITVAQSAELGYLNAGIAITDIFGRQSRMAARGGLGTVMGSKKIKAVLISKKGKYRPEGASSEAFKAARKDFHEIVKSNDRIKVLHDYGTASTVMDVQRLGALPTKNFSVGQFDGSETLSGEYIHDLILKRGGEGKISEPCMAGCIIGCSNAYADEAGKEIVSPLEYETLGLMGSNIGIGDPDVVARFNYICNDYGIDTIDAGGSLGVMAEAGLFAFGDAAAMEAALHEVPKNSYFGRLVGMGTGLAAKFLGVRRAPVVKNQCMSAYDPRGVKGTGITYATTPMGADHTAGLTVFMPVDHHSKEGQIEISRKMQTGRTAYDVLGLCSFLTAATAMRPDAVVAMVNSLYGLSLEPSFLGEVAVKTIQLELAFNRAAGLTAKDDRVPAFIREEALPPFGLTWDIEDEELDSLVRSWES
jgi:aldehyde:ferredoxin oxidoreductase